MYNARVADKRISNSNSSIKITLSWSCLGCCGNAVRYSADIMCSTLYTFKLIPTRLGRYYVSQVVGRYGHNGLKFFVFFLSSFLLFHGSFYTGIHPPCIPIYVGRSRNVFDQNCCNLFRHTLLIGPFPNSGP